MTYTTILDLIIYKSIKIVFFCITVDQLVPFPRLILCALCPIEYRNCTISFANSQFRNLKHLLVNSTGCQRSVWTSPGGNPNHLLPKTRLSMFTDLFIDQRDVQLFTTCNGHLHRFRRQCPDRHRSSYLC